MGKLTLVVFQLSFIPLYLGNVKFSLEKEKFCDTQENHRQPVKIE